jgi:hypothetical protein
VELARHNRVANSYTTPARHSSWASGTTHRVVPSELLRTGHFVFVGVLALLSMLAWFAVATPQSAASSPAAVVTAPAINQCNPPDFPTTAGFQVTCTVTVVNNTSSTGATSSTVTTSACLAAAGVPYPSCPLNSGPITSSTSSNQLVTSVDQCNGIVNGGGSNVYCNVTVTNNTPVGTATAGVTVDQCIGSATGGGSTEACAPSGSTTNATVTQCNGSATGGGTYNGETTVGCTVTGGASALPVTVNQCNGTATGGGSAVTCATSETNDFLVAAATTSSTTTTTAPSGSGLGSGPVKPAAVLQTVIPAGAPQTGVGGAARSDDTPLIALGLVLLVGATTAAAMGLRRHKSLAGRDDPTGGR